MNLSTASAVLFPCKEISDDSKQESRLFQCEARLCNVLLRQLDTRLSIRRLICPKGKAKFGQDQSQCASCSTRTVKNQDGDADV